MIIREVSDEFALDLNQIDPDRSTGVHLSTIIKRIALRMRWLKPDDPDEERFTASGFDTLRVMLGLAWEEWLASAHPWMDFHGGEVRRDRIAMSPDAVSEVGGIRRVHEFKCTWKTARRAIEEEHMYMMQLKSYCYAMRTRHGAMHVYYVNGDYTFKGPMYRVFYIEFTDAELEANWNVITAEASTVSEWKGKA